MAVSFIPYTYNLAGKSMTESVTDLDDIKKSGVYNWTSGSGTRTIVNGPPGMTSGITFTMLVISKQGGPVQILIDNNSNMYFRVCWSTGWQTWRKVTSTVAQ